MNQEVILDGLACVSEQWLAPSPFRTNSVQALAVSTGYAAPLVERALDNVFGEATREKLQEFAYDYSLDEFTDERAARVLHIGAGNVFVSWLHGVLISLLMGFDVYVKPSSNEPVFARLFIDSLRGVRPELADLVHIVPWEAATARQMEAVVAYGSDESLAAIRNQLDSEKIWVGYGHKISVAIAFEESAGPETVHWQTRARNDLEAFELNGCLSPQMLFVEAPVKAVWEKFVCDFRPPPRLQSFSDLAHIDQALRPWRGRLSTLGVAGPLPRVTTIRPELEALGVTRICELGEMQRPPLDWHNGGVSLIEALRPAVEPRRTSGKSSIN